PPRARPDRGCPLLPRQRKPAPPAGVERDRANPLHCPSAHPESGGSPSDCEDPPISLFASDRIDENNRDNCPCLAAASCSSTHTQHAILGFGAVLIPRLLS